MEFFHPYLSFMKRNIENIIKSCIKKDRKAQFRFFEMYSAWGFTICKRYVKDRHKAKEVLQDAFLKIFTKMDTYDNQKGTLKAWMSRIIINCALTTTKKEAFNDSFSEIHNMDGVPAVKENDFFEYSPEMIMRFLHRMPLGYKTVFNLSIMDEYTHKEIAAELGISEITSRSQLRKAKIWLRENITSNTLKTNF